MVTVSDYLIDFLVGRGTNKIFTVSGGGILHLLDSVGRHKSMSYYCNYHEQACAVSAEGFAKVSGGVGACLVTVGPGAVNALSGIVGAWYDSVPVIVISGQVRRDLIADFARVRQFGPQEGNVITMAAPVTKYAKCVVDPQTIRYEMEYAWFTATSGRPGPVWLEIPLDVQNAEIDETKLVGFDAPAEGRMEGESRLQADVQRVIETLAEAKRPLLICGNGIHASHAESLLDTLVRRLGIPVVVPYSAKDLMPEEDPLYVGVFGTAGQRRANFAVQNADCVMSLASGFNLIKVGFNYKGFAPKARKILVDTDEGQLHHQVIQPDLAVRADVGAFMNEFLRQLNGSSIRPSAKWLSACTRWKERYPIIVDEFLEDKEVVNSYVFMDRLADQLQSNDILVVGVGLDAPSYYQAFKIKAGQRTITSHNWGSMGWDLPMAIGASVAREGDRVVCVTGDGGIQWNIQELLTIKHHRFPVKIFVLNNQGYASIRATQKTLCDGRYVGAGRSSGLDNPDFSKLAEAYGLRHTTIQNNDELVTGIERTLALDGCVLCEVNISPEQGISPKASAFKRADGTFESRPLEDMAPFLPREEIHENMHLFDDE